MEMEIFIMTKFLVLMATRPFHEIVVTTKAAAHLKMEIVIKTMWPKGEGHRTKS